MAMTPEQQFDISVELFKAFSMSNANTPQEREYIKQRIDFVKHATKSINAWINYKKTQLLF